MPQAVSMVSGVEEILSYLKTLQGRDAYVEAQIAACNRIGGYWWGGFVISIILLFVLAIAGESNGVLLSFIFLPIIGSIGCLVMGIIYAVRCGNWKKQDYDNRRLALPQQFFSVLGRDISRRTRCALNVSFDDYRTHGTLVEKQGGIFATVRTSKYEDAWFTARGRLCDGNGFKVTITQTVHRKEKPKRKYTKITERFHEEVTLLLKVSPTTYPDCAALATALQPGEYDGLRVSRVLVQGHLVRVTCHTDPAIRRRDRGGTHDTSWDNLADGDTLLRLFLLVYGRLQACRAPQVA